jgi:hypothetical protein
MSHPKGIGAGGLRGARVTALALAAAVVFGAAFAPSAGARGKVRKVSAEDLARMLDAGEPVVVLDVRNGGTSDRIPGAVHVPLDRLEGWARSVRADTKIVAYCA